jgi:predicted kinase
MKQLICMMGLPRSGKTTIAKQLSLHFNAPVVNPDAIRLGLHGQAFDPKFESEVWHIAHVMVKAFFEYGYETVILDATNTNKKARSEWLSDTWATLFYFVDTDASTCLQRASDTGQEYLVDVINRMNSKFQLLDPEETAFDLTKFKIPGIMH